MNLLRDVSWLRLWRRLAIDRRRVTRPVYTVTVPAPLAAAGVTGGHHPVVVTQAVPLPHVVKG
ncbi:hypothetical protein J7I44_08505 [Frateuria sp. MAH-13]|uniref:Uncharacterized protein n=1 Tax=Frateuria flava TaxID=2821489 RepID=A0ABS4DMP7_9GAMM|nr:hypothetical protein [Frateuria flava]MBP1474339.1 hypothetical protein [Frateuria flava]